MHTYHRKKTSLIFATLFFVLFSLLTVIPQRTQAAEVQTNKKIISIVYDDSGSMSMDGEKKWAYANYAMQTFAALLNGQDELYLTYMSDVLAGKQGGRQIDLSDVEAAVSQIRGNINLIGSTPHESIEIAMNTLQNAGDTDPQTEYWLVVLTDGEFGLAPDYNTLVSSSDLQAQLEGYYAQDMPNGTKVQITYMAIGSDAVSLNDNPACNLSCVKAEAAEDIMTVLSDVADKISGRTRVEESAITATKGNTVTFRSELPLYSISILSQGMQTEVTDAEIGESSLTVSRNIGLQYPEINGAQTDKGLLGNAAMITNGSETIPAGEYTIRFSENVDVSSLDIMYEPAIEVQLEIYKDEELIEDTSTLRQGDVIDIIGTVVKAGTSEEIDKDLLPDGISYQISVSEGGQTVNSSDSLELTGVELHNVETLIKGQLQIPGFSPSVQTIPVFTPGVPIVYGIEVEPTEKLSFSLSKLNENTEGIHFYITADGERLSREESEAIGIEILENTGNISYDWKCDSEGAWIFTPKKVFFLMKPFVSSGDQKLTVGLESEKGVTANVQYRVEKSILDVTFPLLLLLLILLFFYVIYKLVRQHRKKFCFNGQIIQQREYMLRGLQLDIGPETTHVFRKKDGKHFLRNSEVNRGGLHFEAVSATNIEISADSLKRFGGAFVVMPRNYNNWNMRRAEANRYLKSLKSAYQQYQGTENPKDVSERLREGDMLLVMISPDQDAFTAYYRTS